MAFEFTCPNCGSRRFIEDHYEDRSGPCALCGEIVIVRRQPEQRGTEVEIPPSEGPTPQSVTAMLAIIFSLLLASGAAGWLIYMFDVLPRSASPADALRLQTVNNLSRIGAALRAYQQVHGTFPPFRIADAQGAPVHSWRVLILPYLGEQDLYRRYRMDQPWNGPDNLQLAHQMPEVFASASDPDNQGSFTSFLAVCGDGTAFPTQGQLGDGHIRDGLNDTVLVVESANSQIVWLQPEDLRVSRMEFQVNGQAGRSIRGMHPGGPHALTADGAVHQLRPDATASALHALTTAAANDSVNWQQLEVP